MIYDYNKWSDKHKDTIALCIGIFYGVIMGIFALLVLRYAH